VARIGTNDGNVEVYYASVLVGVKMYTCEWRRSLVFVCAAVAVARLIGTSTGTQTETHECPFSCRRMRESGGRTEWLKFVTAYIIRGNTHTHTFL